MLRKSLAGALFAFLFASAGLMRADVTSACPDSTGLVTFGVDAGVWPNRYDSGYGIPSGACKTSASLTATADDQYGDGFASASASIGHSGAYAEASGTWASAANAKYWDTITITSTVPNQDYALFTLKLSLNAEFVGNGSGSASAGVQFDAGDNSFRWDKSLGLSSDYDPNAPNSVTEQVYLPVGGVYYLQSGIGVSAFGTCDFSPDDPWTCLPQSEQVFATHSAAFSLVSNTAGASFITASGCALDGNPCGSAPNPSPVPEPASVWLLGSALLGLPELVRRRRQRR